MEPLDLTPLLEPIRDRIEASLRPRLSLRFRDEDATSIHGTRLGGLPAAAAGTPWPAGANGPFTFLGQLDFEELSRLGGPELGLPGAGILALFYDLSVGQTSGDRTAYQLMFTARDPELLTPPPNARILPRRALESTDANIPSMPHFFLDYQPHSWPGWDEAGEDEDGYETGVRAEYASLYYGKVDNQVRGNAHWVQQDPRVASLTPPEAWSLLWQISYQPSWQVQFSENFDSRMYLLIRDEDLAACDFSRTYLTWQTP